MPKSQEYTRSEQMAKYGMVAEKIQGSKFNITYNECEEGILALFPQAYFQVLADNNATYIHNRYGPEVTNHLTQIHDGFGMLWDTTDDATKLPGFWQYVDGIQHWCEKHYACVDYGATHDQLINVLDIRDMGTLTNEQILDCESKAEALTNQIVEWIKKMWKAQMHANVNVFGDRILQYTGHPSIHDIEYHASSNPKKW